MDDQYALLPRTLIGAELVNPVVPELFDNTSLLTLRKNNRYSYHCFILAWGTSERLVHESVIRC